jgi:hypothetical protein
MLQAKLSLEVAAGQGNKKLTRGENETTIRIHKISRIPKDIKLEFQEATSNIIKLGIFHQFWARNGNHHPTSSDLCHSAVPGLEERLVPENRVDDLRHCVPAKG